MEDQMQGFMIPDEPKVMNDITSAVLAALRSSTQGRYVPMPVAVNAMATAMARTTMLAILDLAEENRQGASFEMEAFRRIIDAVASMEDYRDRKTPWRLQSSKLKEGERAGATVMNAHDMKDKATKQ